MGIFIGMMRLLPGENGWKSGVCQTLDAKAVGCGELGERENNPPPEDRHVEEARQRARGAEEN